MASAPSIEEKLRTWLASQGYPLELMVARHFQRTGALVVQSDYYSDPVTQESREIDVVASWHDDIDRIFVRVSVLVECKASRDKPWLLFSSPETRLAAPARVAQRAGSQLARLALREIAKNNEVQALPMFQVPDCPAYGVRQGFAEKVDVCFAAISGVAAAAAAHSKLPDSQNSLLGRLDLLEIILPVVVTDARLFSVLLDAEGELEINERDSGVLLWRNPVVGLPHTIVHVVRSSSLPTFCEMISKSATDFLTMCRGPLRDVLLAARENRIHQRTLGK